jgi:hypothetical protein
VTADIGLAGRDLFPGLTVGDAQPRYGFWLGLLLLAVLATANCVELVRLSRDPARVAGELTEQPST